MPSEGNDGPPASPGRIREADAKAQAIAVHGANQSFDQEVDTMLQSPNHKTLPAYINAENIYVRVRGTAQPAHF